MRPTLSVSRWFSLSRFTGAICFLLFFSANALLAGHGDVQPGHHLLTINVVGNGLTGAVGVVPLAVVCNLPDPTGGQCVYAVPDGTAVRLNGNAPSTPAVFSAGTGSAAGCVTSTCRFDMTGPASITATFDLLAPKVTMSITLAGDGPGEVFMDNTRCQNYDHDLSHLPTQYSGCQSNYAPGSEVDLLAWPPSASRFNEFSAGTNAAGVCGAAARCIFLLNDHSAVTARFSALTSIVVTPPDDTISIGQSRQYTATGTYSDASTQPIDGRTGTWKTRTSMDEPRFNFAAAAAGGRAYAFGGINGRQPGSSMLASVESFDPATNTWTARQSMTGPRAGPAAAADGHFIYVVGGNVGGACPIANLDRYDTQLDAWGPLDPMPAGPRRNLSAVVVGRTLYAIGGEFNQCFESSGTPLAVMEAYDLDTGAWSTSAPMPTPRSGFGVAVVDGIIYAIGGGNTSGNLDTVEAYEPATNTWTTKAPMPSGRSLLTVASIDKLIYAIGGNNGTYTDTVFAYDPSTNGWSNKVQLPSLIDTVGPNSEFANIPGRRAQLSAATVNGVIYVMGGLVNDSGDPPPPPVDIVLSFVDGLVWNSSDTSVATIVNQNLSGFAFGRATALQDGVTNITAKVGTMSCSTSPGQCAILTVNSVVANTLPVVTIFGTPMGNPTATINRGQSLTRNGSFYDPDSSQTWSATVDYGDNTGQQPLALDPGSPPNGPTGTFSLNHVYNQSGVFTVTVTVTDSAGGAGTATMTVTVTAPQISLGLPTSASTDVNSSNSFACGSFFQSNPGSDIFSATVNYGDSPTVQGLTVTPGGSCGGGGSSTGTFSFNHVYATTGTFPVSVTVTNETTGASKSGSFQVVVGEEEDPDPGCAVVTTNIVAGSVSFTTIQMTLFLRTTGEELFTEDVPLGTTVLGEAPPGQYRAVFTVPAGYVITPAEIEFDAICGTPVLLTAHITVADTTPPVIASVTPDANSLWPPNRKMVPVALAVSVTDAIDPAPSCSITGVSSNEAVGETAPDWQFSANSLTTELRAERDSNRTYTITVTCTDGSGNSSSRSAEVRVAQNLRK